MKVIAAVDGTPVSEAALEALMAMKFAEGTEIKLLSVLKPGETPLLAMLKGGRQGADHTQLQESAKAALEEMRGRVEASMPGCKLSYELLQGDPKVKISEAARNWSANLIVMGSRGNKGVDLIVLGSVSQGVLMQAPCPVIIVKPEEKRSIGDGFKNVLIAMDNSPYSQAALNWLKGLDWGSDVRFKLISVVQSLSDTLVDEQLAVRSSAVVLEHETTVAMAETELQIHANELSTKVDGSRIITEVLEGDPREAILQAASDWPAHLIVMGSHGRTGLTKLLIGSVSQAVAVHADCSVAIVRGLVAKGQSDPMQKTGAFKMDKSKLNREVASRRIDSDE